MPKQDTQQEQAQQKDFPATWDKVPEPMRSTMRRFVEQIDLTRRPATRDAYDLSFRDFGSWLADTYPDVTAIAHIRRQHIEAYKCWTTRDRIAYSHAAKGDQLSAGTICRRLSDLATFLRDKYR